MKNWIKETFAWTLVGIMTFAISTLSLLTTEMGLHGLRSEKFWIGYLITLTIGVLSRFVFMNKGFETSRNEDEYKAVAHRIKIIGSRIVKGALTRELNEFVKIYNEENVLALKLAKLEELLIKKPEEYANLQALYKETGDIELLKEIKIKYTPATVKQLLSAYTVSPSGGNPFISNTSGVFIKKAFAGMILTMIATLIFQSVAVSGSIDWSGLYDLFVKMFNMIMGLYIGYTASQDTVKVEELPAMTERLRTLELFCKEQEIDTTDIQYKISQTNL